MKKFLAAMILFLMTSNTAASHKVDGIKEKNLDTSAEARVFDSSPEFIFRHKNFSIDWIHDDKNFFKLKMDKEIFSLMGTGIEWNVALNAVDENSAVLPSIGINLYARIRPRLDIYLQFSGLPLGSHRHITDFESGIKYFPQKNLSICAGWRQIDFKQRYSNFYLRGLFAGVRYNF